MVLLFVLVGVVGYILIIDLREGLGNWMHYLLITLKIKLNTTRAKNVLTIFNHNLCIFLTIILAKIIGVFKLIILNDFLIAI